MGRKRWIWGALIVAAAGAGAVWYIERPKTTEVPFAHLPYSRVDYSPEAPEGFPDCAPEMLNMKIEDTERHVNVTLRPKPGVQCGVQVFPDGWWKDATGERFEAKTPDSKWVGRRLLLMGRNGASDTGSVDKACTMQAPITYYLELAGEPFAVGTIEKRPPCWGNRNRNRLFAPYMLYRDGGLETPAGWMDGSIEDLEIGSSDLSFTFVLVNDTGEDIDLSRCPLIDVELQPGDTERKGFGYRTYLNCPGAPDVAGPGDVLRFPIQAPLSEVGDGDTIEVEFRDELRVMYRVSQEAES